MKIEDVIAVLGFVVMVIGVACLDSTNVIIPATITLIGAVAMSIGGALVRRREQI